MIHVPRKFKGDKPGPFMGIISELSFQIANMANNDGATVHRLVRETPLGRVEVMRVNDTEFVHVKAVSEEDVYLFCTFNGYTATTGGEVIRLWNSVTSAYETKTVDAGGLCGPFTVQTLSAYPELGYSAARDYYSYWQEVTEALSTHRVGYYVTVNPTYRVDQYSSFYEAKPFGATSLTAEKFIKQVAYVRHTAKVSACEIGTETVGGKTYSVRRVKFAGLYRFEHKETEKAVANYADNPPLIPGTGHGWEKYDADHVTEAQSIAITSADYTCRCQWEGDQCYFGWNLQYITDYYCHAFPVEFIILTDEYGTSPVFNQQSFSTEDRYPGYNQGLIYDEDCAAAYGTEIPSGHTHGEALVNYKRQATGANNTMDYRMSLTPEKESTGTFIF